MLPETNEMNFQDFKAMRKADSEEKHSKDKEITAAVENNTDVFGIFEKETDASKIIEIGQSTTDSAQNLLLEDFPEFKTTFDSPLLNIPEEPEDLRTRHDPSFEIKNTRDENKDCKTSSAEVPEDTDLLSFKTEESNLDSIVSQEDDPESGKFSEKSELGISKTTFDELSQFFM